MIDDETLSLQDDVNREYPALSKAIWGLIAAQPPDAVAAISSLSALAYVTAMLLDCGHDVKVGRKLFIELLDGNLRHMAEP